MMSNAPRDRVLSTLELDGSRHWIDPKLSKGRFLRRRRIVGYALIALFVALPFVKIGGRPAVLLDLVTRELSLFGMVFRPSSGFLIMLLGLTVVVTVFLVTALFGRVWCGWGCPQTVYLELVFRPIERLTKKRPALKWAIYAVLAFALANVFLAYFVGVARLRIWVIGSPLDHLGGFSLVVGVAALMLFDFGYFREQMCIITCPYGRLQSVLLDKDSLLIGYDAKRGEPRGKPHKKLAVIADAPSLGDCVDCGACVRTCPTGIDIRDGLQMECIGCAQCIDACDVVMDKLERPRGLIGYRSTGRILRARTMIYPALLALVGSLLVWSVATQSSTEVWITRISGPQFVEIDAATVSSAVRVKLENDTDTARHYTITIRDADLKLRTPQIRWDVKPRKSIDIPLFVDVPRTAFVHGKRTTAIYIDDSAGFHRVVAVTLMGPEGASK
jgi:cytochrome c oxidase accessory protein FixG